MTAVAIEVDAETGILLTDHVARIVAFVHGNVVEGQRDFTRRPRTSVAGQIGGYRCRPDSEKHRNSSQ